MQYAEENNKCCVLTVYDFRNAKGIKQRTYVMRCQTCMEVFQSPKNDEGC